MQDQKNGNSREGQMYDYMIIKPKEEDSVEGKNTQVIKLFLFFSL